MVRRRGRAIGQPGLGFRRSMTDRRNLIAGRIVVVFAPILALLACVPLLAVAAWWYGAYRPELFLAAGVAAAGAGIWAVAQLYRQVRLRQSANRALRSAEARMVDVVDSAMDPIITVDDEQRIVMCNTAAEQVFRCPRQAMLGTPLDTLIPERFRQVHRLHIERFGETGITARRMGTQAVLMALRGNGEEFPIEASISHHSEDGQQLYTVILRDISERVRAQELLAGSEARLRGILDSAMDAIVTVDETQHIVLFNAAAEAMFGYASAEALGAPLTHFIPERFRAGHGEHVRRFGEEGTASRRMAARRIVTGQRRNGEEFPIDASISQLSDNGGKLYTVILRDVTDRVRAEEALRRSKKELQELGAAGHLAREQEKSRIARELHDELAQALAALQMDVAWCKKKFPGAQDGVAKKLERMERLLDSTVAATRRIAADLRPLMLDDLGLIPALEWLVENFMERAGIPCALAVNDPELQLQGLHATAVFRIVQEALANIGKHASASRAEVTIEHHAAELTIMVRDDGVGFSAHEARKPNSFGHIGLRERASLLGGETRITSAPGQGTQVAVRLPVTATQP